MELDKKTNLFPPPLSEVKPYCCKAYSIVQKKLKDCLLRTMRKEIMTAGQ